MRCGLMVGMKPVLLTIPLITPFIEPPGTPPGTPPTTPEVIGGGASSSLIISTFLGILVGVRSCPFTMSVCTCLTICTSAGGGGGGGGGGATSAIINCALGKASVNSSGIRTMKPIIPTCTKKENIVVAPLLVFNFPPDSIKLSSNINLPPATQSYISFRHQPSPICSHSLAKVVLRLRFLFLSTTGIPLGRNHRRLVPARSPILIGHQDRRRNGN